MEAALQNANEDTRQKLLDAMHQIESGCEEQKTLEWVRGTLSKVPVSDCSEQSEQRVAPLLADHHESREEASKPNEVVQRLKHHIYGSKVALTLELDTLKSPDSTGAPIYTVLVEAAPAIAARRFDWERKIPFQIMRRELPLVACALMGLLNEPLTLANHGKEANKALRIEDQGANLFVKVSHASRVLVLPVGASDLYAWLELVMHALNRNSNGLGDAVQMAMLRRVATLVNHGKSSA